MRFSCNMIVSFHFSRYRFLFCTSARSFYIFTSRSNTLILNSFLFNTLYLIFRPSWFLDPLTGMYTMLTFDMLREKVPPKILLLAHLALIRPVLIVSPFMVLLVSNWWEGLVAMITWEGFLPGMSAHVDSHVSALFENLITAWEVTLNGMSLS